MPIVHTRTKGGLEASCPVTAMADYPYIVFSALCIIFSIVPFSWQAIHRNSGPTCLTGWVIVVNLNNLVRSFRELATVNRS
jgi:hypothetical protein